MLSFQIWVGWLLDEICGCLREGSGTFRECLERLRDWDPELGWLLDDIRGCFVEVIGMVCDCYDRLREWEWGPKRKRCMVYFNKVRYEHLFSGTTSTIEHLQRKFQYDLIFSVLKSDEKIKDAGFISWVGSTCMFVAYLTEEQMRAIERQSSALVAECVNAYLCVEWNKSDLAPRMLKSDTESIRDGGLMSAPSKCQGLRQNDTRKRVPCNRDINHTGAM